MVEAQLLALLETSRELSPEMLAVLDEAVVILRADALPRIVLPVLEVTPHTPAVVTRCVRPINDTDSVDNIENWSPAFTPHG